MSKITLHARSTWTSAPAPDYVSLHNADVKYFVVHYPGAGPDQANKDPRESLRGWRNFHVQTRGWRDIAYNYAVDLSGRIWTLRGWAQDGGVKGMGGKCVSCLLILGGTEEMSDAMKESVVALADWVDNRVGRGLARTYHGRLVSTDCPGTDATRWVKAGMPVPSAAKPAPTTRPTAPISANQLPVDGSFGDVSWGVLDQVNRVKYRATGANRVVRLQRVLNHIASRNGWERRISNVNGRLDAETLSMWAACVGISPDPWPAVTTLTDELARRTQQLLRDGRW